ncbi:hypothetical protein [Actinoallomurus rhizosphaericola]|uniref:hypothetical protein n=1 Tax=Actinoallomurus rhizosphaericola TaxID=2952536 RepID=UPI0020901F74|nr:hypothetical protein [Actinoallomurus rhizosphaericola]MCO5994075.1 hypothetical protein [Actinoallomurus rhizosphaericola]
MTSGAKVEGLFTERVVQSGRLPLFCFFVAFIVTFVVVRINVRLIRAKVRWWFKNVEVGELHIHHVVFGVVLMLIGGVAGFCIPDAYTEWYALAASVFGVGAALVLDEFALILHLRDVYWMEEGRASVDAVFIAVAITGLILVGVRPLWLSDVHDLRADATVSLGVFLVVLANILVNLALAIVTLFKGKIWTGLLGLFLPVVLVFSAFRLARPGSPWARWRYRPGTRKFRRALRREQRIRRPLIRAKIWVQEFIAGRHDLIAHERTVGPRRRLDRRRRP